MVGERDLRRTFPCLSEGEPLLLTDLRTTSGALGSADLRLQTMVKTGNLNKPVEMIRLVVLLNPK